MARKSKLPRYKEFNQATNAFGFRAQDPKTIFDYLPSNRPLTLELGCGKAEVSLALAAQHKQENFIGVDLKADRLWKASKNAIAAKLNNVVFLQSNILEIAEYFKPDSIDKIWITFPDPFPKKRQIKHRMLSRQFLNIYKTLLKPGKKVHFKTDNSDLFQWALETLLVQKDVDIIEVSFDLHSSELPPETKIMTGYEQRFVSDGLKINYLNFEFN